MGREGGGGPIAVVGMWLQGGPGGPMGAEAGGCWKSCALSPWDGNGAVPGPSPLQGGSPQAPLLHPAAQPRCPRSSSPPPQPGWTGGRGGDTHRHIPVPFQHPHPNGSTSPAGVRAGGSNTQPGWGAEKGGGGRRPRPPRWVGRVPRSSVGPGVEGDEVSPRRRRQRRWARGLGVSAGAAARAGFVAVAHQALVGFEAGQGLAAGQGGQGAAEPQHGGRGVLPWGGTERASRGAAGGDGDGDGEHPFGIAADGLGTPWLYGQRP